MDNIKEIEEALEGSLQLAFEEYKSCIYNEDAEKDMLIKFDTIIKEYNDIFYEYINGKFYYEYKYDKKNGEICLDVKIKKDNFFKRRK